MEYKANLYSDGGYDRNALIESHYKLVRSVVNTMLKTLPPYADAEELHSAGLMGLINAVDRYDESKKATFKGYAALRIRGAVLDELRRIDLLPRTTRQKTKNIQEAEHRLEQELGRAPDDQEVAKELGMDDASFRKYKFKARPVQVMSLDGASDQSGDDPTDLHEIIATDERRSTPEQVEDAELIGHVENQLHKLPERHQKILSMYYFEGLRLAEIAKHFGVTEARICQLHKKALTTIRAAMPLCT